MEMYGDDSIGPIKDSFAAPIMNLNTVVRTTNEHIEQLIAIMIATQNDVAPMLQGDLPAYSVPPVNAQPAPPAVYASEVPPAYVTTPAPPPVYAQGPPATRTTHRKQGRYNPSVGKPPPPGGDILATIGGLVGG